jgi:hypothetical protein
LLLAIGVTSACVAQSRLQALHDGGRFRLEALEEVYSAPTLVTLAGETLHVVLLHLALNVSCRRTLLKQRVHRFGKCRRLATLQLVEFVQAVARLGVGGATRLQRTRDCRLEMLQPSGGSAGRERAAIWSRNTTTTAPCGANRRPSTTHGRPIR